MHTCGILVQVATTYPAPLNLDDTLSGPRFRDGHIFNPNVSIAVESCCSHRRHGENSTVVHENCNSKPSENVQGIRVVICTLSSRGRVQLRCGISNLG